MKTLVSALFLLLAIGVSTTSFAAAPTVEHLFPAGGQIGQTVTVKAIGKFSSGAIGVWCSRPEIKVTATGKTTSSRSLSIRIPKTETPGVCWIRLHNAEGASALRPFVVGTVAEVAEKEPNNRLTDAIPVFSKPTMINGVLSKSRDVDNFAIALKKGVTLVAAMTANNTLGSPMDGILQIVSERGFVLAQNDDHVGFDPRIVFVAPADGKYFVRTFAFPTKPNSTVRFAGAANFIYRLTITSGPFVDYAYPLTVRRSTTEPVQLRGWNLPASLQRFASIAPPSLDAIAVWSPRLANATTVERVDVDAFTEESWKSANANRAGETPVVISGHLSQVGEVDRFRFRAKKGQRLTISVASRALGFPMDPVLRVDDAKGKTIKRVETRSSTAIDESMTLTIPADGEYVAAVSDLHGRGGSRFVYRLSLLTPQASFQLAVKSDAFELTPGKPVSIPVTITRENGFRGEIVFSVTGLPQGVVLKPVKSLAKGATAKTVSLTLTANAKTAAASGPIRIVGTSTGKPALRQIADGPITGLPAKTTDLWLTVIKPVAKKKPKKK